jgi:ABC-type dipeptide/oligopeptide/nickel transport system ATPase subunit
MPLLKIENIFYSIRTKSTDKDKFTVLKNISFTVEEGEILGICGESGGGKSTLARVIAGIIKPNSGRVIFDFSNGKSKHENKPIQILFQNHGEILNPFRKVQNMIDEALEISGIDKNKIESERNRIMNSVGLPISLYQRRGYQLSGGEQQRAALARLLAAKPSLLILDEPFSAQDVESQFKFVKLFKKLNKDFNLTMICISHDLRILRKLTERLIIFKDGEIVEIGETKKIFDHPEEDYTKFLLSAEALNLTQEELQTLSKN